MVIPSGLTLHQSVEIILISLSALYYVWFISIAYRGLRRLRTSPEPAAPSRKVSVLVPARNEEQNIGRCVGALLNQDYPDDLLEVIVVDDDSTDRTAEIVLSLSAKYGRVRLLRLGREERTNPSVKRGRKPEALTLAISRATGDIIVTTDADCAAPRTWVRSLVGHLEGETVYVVGPVLEEPGSTLFERLRFLEVLGGMTITAGRIGAGRPINGHGGNTAFLKAIYTQTGGFDFRAVKSDEEAMMHKIIDSRLGTVSFAATPLARLRTRSPESFSGFWNQRMRWGSMHRHFVKRGILIQLAALYFSILLPLAGLFAGIFDTPVLSAAVVALAVKVAVDFLALKCGSRLFGERVSPGTFLIAELVHSLYIVVFGGLAQVIRYRWKDRTVLAFDASGNAAAPGGDSRQSLR